MALWAVRWEAQHPWRRFYSHGAAQATVISAIGILLPVALWHYHESRRITPAISELVVPYPGADQPQSDVGLALAPMVEFMSGDTAEFRRLLASARAERAHTYLVHTADAPDLVMRFYRDATHRPGWTLVEDDSMVLILRRGPQVLVLGARDVGYGRGTSILYFVRRAP